MDIPWDVVKYNILPYCDIDTRLAFKIKPNKLETKILELKIDLHEFEIIARSHLQVIKNLYEWFPKLEKLFNFFNIKDDLRSFLTMKLLFVPQYKIVHGERWRKEIGLMAGVDIDYIHFLNEPDITIYSTLYLSKKNLIKQHF